MIIKILGSGCRKCMALGENAKAAVAAAGKEAEIVKVTDIAQKLRDGCSKGRLFHGHADAPAAHRSLARRLRRGAPHQPRRPHAERVCNSVRIGPHHEQD